MSAPYRPDPDQARDTHVVGAELRVRGGARLPRVCVTCGAKKSLVEETHTHEWRPGAAPLLRLFGILGQAVEGSLARTAQLTYSTCKACTRRARDQQDVVNVVVFASVVVLLVAATLGLNGYPYAGVAVATLGAGAVFLVLRRLHRGRSASISIAYIHSDGTVHLRGVCNEAARIAVEDRRDAAGEKICEDEDEDEDGDEDEDEDEDDTRDKSVP